MRRWPSSGPSAALPSSSQPMPAPASADCRWTSRGAPFFWRERVAELRLILDRLQDVAHQAPGLEGRLDPARIAAAVTPSVATPSASCSAPPSTAKHFAIADYGRCPAGRAGVAGRIFCRRARRVSPSSISISVESLRPAWWSAGRRMPRTSPPGAGLACRSLSRCGGLLGAAHADGGGPRTGWDCRPRCQGDRNRIAGHAGGDEADDVAWLQTELRLDPSAWSAPVTLCGRRLPLSARWRKGPPRDGRPSAHGLADRPCEEPMRARDLPVGDGVGGLLRCRLNGWPFAAAGRA